MTSAGTQKVLRKLEASLEAGQFYEAHEMFKTVYYRHRARGQAEESYALCCEGARLQLQRGQLNCGLELCMLLVEAYAADGLQPGEAAVARVAALVDAFPREARPPADHPPVHECAQFVAAAVKWLRGASDWLHEAQLEGRLAAYITASLGWQGLGYALPHYARAGDAAAMAAAVAAAAAQGSPEEEDLFVARAALTMAAARPPPGAPPSVALPQQLAAAQRVLGAAYAAAAGHAPPDTPLLRFASFFLEALGRRSDELARVLLERYAPSIDRDPALWQVVGKCRSLHLPAAAGAGGMGGLLSGMLNMLAQPSG